MNLHTLSEEKYSVYKSKNNTYSIEIETSNKVNVEAIPSGYKENFTVLGDNSSVKYVVDIIELKTYGDSYETLLSEGYKQNFLSTCNCTITESKEVKYKSFKGVRYSKKIETPKRTLLGYTVSTIVNDNIFVISYSTTEQNFKKFEKEFEHSINSIVFTK